MEAEQRSPPAAWLEKHGYPPEDGQPFELYDLKSDPGQRKNLAAEQPQRVAELRARLDQARMTSRSAP